MDVVGALTRARRRQWLLDGWVLLVALAVTWPMFRSGQLLARDLVFTQHPPLRPESFGVGTAAPRAVPLDAVVAALSALVGGDLLGRAAVLAGLLLAGAGAHRAVRSLLAVPRALAAGLAIWNPFVLERLALGQWALLLAYAALFPIVASSPSVREGRRSVWTLGPLVALAALTPTGGLMAGAVVVALTVVRGRWWPPVGLALLAQVPWVLPLAIGASGALSSPAGLAAFAARAERPGGTLWSLLGWGGMWDAMSMAPSRAGLLGHLTAVTFVALLVVALLHRRRQRATGEPARIPDRLWLVGAVGLVIAWVPSIGAFADALGRAMSVIPGLGLWRDSQKWLAPWVVLGVLASALGCAALLGRVRRSAPAAAGSLVLVAVLLPFLLMPDGAIRGWATLTPSTTPRIVGQIAATVDGSEGLLVTAPLRSYRRFAWTSRRLAVYDPASRWFDVRVVVQDTLHVGSTTIPGEDPLTRELERAWSSPQRDAALADLGVRWIVGYRDDPAFDDLAPGAGAPVVEDETLVLWRIAAGPGSVPAPAMAVGLTDPRTLVVIAVDVVIGGVLLLRPLAGRVRRSPGFFANSQ